MPPLGVLWTVAPGGAEGYTVCRAPDNPWRTQMSTQRDPPQRYLSVPGAAETVRISVSWLRKATRRGELTHARLGAPIVHDREDLDEYVHHRKADEA
jgi:excisionase family DNA binding protein